MGNPAENTNSKEPIFNIRLGIGLLVFFFIGLLLLLAGSGEQPTKWQHLGRELGVLFLTITPVTFFYEAILRNHLKREMKNEIGNCISEIIEKHGLERHLQKAQENVVSVILKSMPNSYKNILQNGVVDVFPDLRQDDFIKRIEESHDVEIRFLEIWLPFFDETFHYDYIVESIKRGCSYKIIIYDWECEDVLKNRAMSIDPNMTAESYIRHINGNLSYFRLIYLKLKEIGKEDKFQVRLNDKFIAISLFGFGDYYIFGLYLNRQLSNTAMQYRINKKKFDDDSDAKFYDNLDKHFETQWTLASNSIQFDQNGYKKVPVMECAVLQEFSETV